MSEFQYVAFRAVDAPVTPKNLAYMRRQSTHAEITPRSFDNEYHYGDFRGDALEMLRRGYDVHLHYANFGVRRLAIRFPYGLPDAKAAKQYFDQESLEFKKDKQGKGGVLWIETNYESGEIEDLWDIDRLIDRLVPLRAELLAGDLRPLYLAHLAVSCDDQHDPEDAHESPVPAGLKKLSEAQRALAEFLGLNESIIAAAAEESPSLSTQGDPAAVQAEWLDRQSEEMKTKWLVESVTDSNPSIRADILAKFRASRHDPSWPTTTPNRTIAQLETSAEQITQRAQLKAVAAAARQRARRSKEMSADPARFLREAEQLAAERTMDAYRQVSELLGELRDALADGGRSDLAEKQAQKLKQKNPTFRGLAAALRRQGFLAK